MKARNAIGTKDALGWGVTQSATVHYKQPRNSIHKLLGTVAVVTLLTVSTVAFGDDVSVLQQATSGHPSSPHDNVLGYATALEDAYLATRPAPAWTLPGEQLGLFSYSPVGLTLYENNVLPRLGPWPLHQASAWALLWGGTGLFAGTAMWLSSGEPSAVSDAAVGGALIGAPLGFLLGTAEASVSGLSGGRLLPNNVRITLTAIQLERAADPISRPHVTVAVLPAVVGDFF